MTRDSGCLSRARLGHGSHVAGPGALQVSRLPQPRDSTVTVAATVRAPGGPVPSHRAAAGEARAEFTVSVPPDFKALTVSVPPDFKALTVTVTVTE